MNLFFWKKKKYDDEMETYLKGSQLYPHIKAALEVMDNCISGDLHLEHRIHLKKTIEHTLVDLWHITPRSIELHAYTKQQECVLSVKCSYFSKSHTTYEFVLTLPLNNGEKEIIHIEQTKLYEEIKEKMFYLHNPERFSESKKNRSKRILKENAQKHRLQNLFK